MAFALNTTQQNIDPADALWTLFISQPKAIQDRFVSKIEQMLSTQHKSVQKLTYAEINARLDQVEHDILSGNTIASEDVHNSIKEKCPWL